MINIRDKDYLLAFGIYLKDVRLRMGFTQKQLALDSDISISQISRIERGLVNVSICTLQVISQALEQPLSDMLQDFDNLEFKIVD